uniref:Uncharacterized protein n=1 Tax=Oryza nivara TaxID=4536 RepID=A0A0E0H2N1_ORYNI
MDPRLLDSPSSAPPPRHRQRPPSVVLPERPCARLMTGVEGCGQAPGMESAVRAVRTDAVVEADRHRRRCVGRGVRRALGGESGRRAALARAEDGQVRRRPFGHRAERTGGGGGRRRGSVKERLGRTTPGGRRRWRVHAQANKQQQLVVGLS